MATSVGYIFADPPRQKSALRRRRKDGKYRCHFGGVDAILFSLREVKYERNEGGERYKRTNEYRTGDDARTISAHRLTAKMRQGGLVVSPRLSCPSLGSRGIGARHSRILP